MISRRDFVKAAAAALPLSVAAGFAGPSRQGAPAGGRQPGRLCTIAYNVLQCTGWPPANVKKRFSLAQNQMSARFALELALYAPDIINFSEAPDEGVVRDIADRLGMKYVFFPSGESWPGALMTRFEIAGSQNCPVKSGSRPKDLFTRHWGMARLRNPTTKDEIVVHSVHLHPNRVETRSREVTAILETLEPDLKGGRSILMQGDLNSAPDGPEYPRWLAAGLKDTCSSPTEGSSETFYSSEPKRRIDYVFVAGPLANYLKEGRRLFEGAFRTNKNDPASIALSDHVPEMAVFEMP
jgi:endonuclease/exonuclease/phosphatase family metal-dependent hydrolase